MSWPRFFELRFQVLRSKPKFIQCQKNDSLKISMFVHIIQIVISISKKLDKNVLIEIAVSSFFSKPT